MKLTDEQAKILGHMVASQIQEWADKPVNEGSSEPAQVRVKLPWGIQAKRDHGQEFIDGLLWIQAQLGLPADYLITCMKFESNINPKARNPQSSASGLIQFMSSTAKELGTTIELIRERDAMGQLSLVYRYFARFGKDLSDWNLADTYMAILYPAAVGKAPDYRVFVNDPAKFKDAYDVNRGLDKNKDGVITKDEATAKVEGLYLEGYAPANLLVLN